MKHVPLYDGEENIGSVPLVTNLDTWDGMRWRFQRTGCHLGVGKLNDGRYYACYSSDWPEGIVRRKREDGTHEVLFRKEDLVDVNQMYCIHCKESKLRCLSSKHHNKVFTFAGMAVLPSAKMSQVWCQTLSFMPNNAYLAGILKM